jgi:hypothetical protein
LHGRGALVAECAAMIELLLWLFVISFVAETFTPGSVK